MPVLISASQREREFRADYKKLTDEYGKNCQDTEAYQELVVKYNFEIEYYSKINKNEVYLPSMTNPLTQAVMFFLEDRPNQWRK
jgi:hypothetical protein